jgi:hypothetical protein
MGFPHDQQAPQPVDFAAAGLDTRDERRTSTLLVCIECRRPWFVAGERWRLKVTGDNPPETVPYCPDCATREFDAG